MAKETRHLQATVAPFRALPMAATIPHLRITALLLKGERVACPLPPDPPHTGEGLEGAVVVGVEIIMVVAAAEDTGNHQSGEGEGLAPLEGGGAEGFLFQPLLHGEEVSLFFLHYSGFLQSIHS